MGPGGEAILDPRFLVRCPAHRPAPAPAPPVPLPKIDSPLFTIEKIIESELKTLSQPSPAPAPASPAPSSPSSASSAPLSLSARDRCPELNRAIQSVRYIAAFTKEEIENGKAKEDWKFVAMVLDRLFLWIFSVAVVGQ